jgi:hypothetical protein
LEDGSLECDVGAYEPAVYALTICIPRTIYDVMKDDPTLKILDIIKDAWHDEEKQVVYLCGEIGESPFGKVLSYLKKTRR